MYKPVKTIALCGKKGSGKDTTCDIIANIMPIKRLSFAKKLKDVCMLVFNLREELVYNPKYKDKPFQEPILLNWIDLAKVLNKYNKTPALYKEVLDKVVGRYLRTPREVLQIIGTDVLREVNSNIHIKTVIDQLNSDGTEVNVITDVRFENELTALQNHSNYFVPTYIERNSTNKNKKDTHVSESSADELKRSCILVKNDGSLEELQMTIHRLIAGVFN